MKIYTVGGAVRDRLLGIEVTDIDRVVVGATTEEMLAKGYKPVGAARRLWRLFRRRWAWILAVE